MIEEIETAQDREAAAVFALGGNVSTLALVNSFQVEPQGSIIAHLVALAWTPVGVTIGTHVQSVRIEIHSLADWIDKTFPPEDEHSFVPPVRDIELLARLQWHAPMPEALDDAAIVNVDDVPNEIVEALSRPAREIVQCAICRRLSVKDDFIWKDRQLCAWDYHVQVFGKRGPWHNGPYENRHFATVPHCAYVAPPLLEELNVEIILSAGDISAEVAHGTINLVLGADPTGSHLAVRTESGYTVLRETRA